MAQKTAQRPRSAPAKAARSKAAPPQTTTPKSGATPFVRPADGAFWLMKSEPDVYGIDDLARDGSTGWEGVRNYLARNYMRDHMRVGDLVLFYHSNAEPPGVAGVARVVSAPIPDPSQFDPKSPYHDADSDPAAPRWMMVRVAFEERLARVVPLDELKDDPALAGMPLLQRGQRLSVQPVSRAHFAYVLSRAGARTAL